MSQSLQYKPMQLQNKVINRWLLTGIFTRTMRFEPMTMEGDVNDWLLKGFSIHENPCRKEFVRERRTQTPVYPLEGRPVPGGTASLWQQTKEWNPYFPWGNPRVEQSGFWYVPTHLYCYGYTTLVCPKPHKAALRIKTCGGVALWINGRLVVDFTPFTRNIEAETTVQVDFMEGVNTLVICHEDLAERDTLYHFVVEYIGEEDNVIHIPLGDEDDAAAIARMERALTEAYLPVDTFKDTNIRLMIANPAAEDVVFEISYGSFFDGLHRMERVLDKGSQEFVLGHTDQFGIDYKYFQLETKVGKVRIHKLFGMQLYNSRFQPASSEGMTVSDRKRLALQCVAEMGSSNIHTALAMLKTGVDAHRAEELILIGLEGINERRDCADFHLIALFKLWQDYRNSGLLEEDFWDRVKRSMLDFRYWIDEPGDDVMWFFSENHALLFHSCELLAGQLFPDEYFTNNRETGAVHRAKAERRLTEWFERFFAEGLAEWNSNAYIPIDVVGLVQIYELASSEHLRAQAQKALDLLYYYLAVNAHEGYLACTYGRSYEKELIGHYAAGTASLCWVGYGNGNVNSYTINVSLYLSDYEPPQEYAKHGRLIAGDELVFKVEQGKDGYAKLYNYRTKDFCLSSIYDFRPGYKGYQEHVVHAALSPEAHVWINHPGELHLYGTGRPCFWAGNGYLPKVAQYRGLSLLLYDVDASHAADFTHAYFPAYLFDRVERRNGWYFAEYSDAFVAVYAANGLQMTSSGANIGRELVSIGRQNVWVLRISNRLTSGSFERFIERMSKSELRASTEGLSVKLEDPEYGTISLTWTEPLKVNGDVQVMDGFGVKGRLERFGGPIV